MKATANSVLCLGVLLTVLAALVSGCLVYGDGRYYPGDGYYYDGGYDGYYDGGGEHAEPWHHGDRDGDRH